MKCFFAIVYRRFFSEYMLFINQQIKIKKKKFDENIMINKEKTIKVFL